MTLPMSSGWLSKLWTSSERVVNVTSRGEDSLRHGQLKETSSSADRGLLADHEHDAFFAWNYRARLKMSEVK